MHTELGIQKPGASLLKRSMEEGMDGVWLIDKTNGNVSWVGISKPPKLNIYKRIAVAYFVCTSPKSIIPNFRLMKEVIKGLNSPQVSSSGKLIEITGLSFEEEWARFSRTE